MSNPTLRFKSAYGLNFPDTVSCTLSDISKYSKGTIERKNCLFIGNEQLVSNFGGATLEFRTEAKGTEFNSGDILFGNIRPYLKKVWLSHQSGIASPDVLIFKVTDSIPGYLKCILSSERFFNHVAQGYKGSKMPRGDKHQIMDFRIQCPCLEEQQKIASFFSTLDQKIELNERKLEALEKLKKGLMQKIFDHEFSFKNKEGKKFPEWSKMCLKNILHFQNGINTNKENFGAGIKLISVNEVLSPFPIKYDDISSSVMVDEEVGEKFSVSYGDVLFQRSSETREDAGTSNVYVDNIREAVFGGFVIRGKRIGDYNPIFLHELLRSPKVRQQIIKYAQGAQHINIGQESLEKIEIKLPCREEQEKIAELAIALYKKIELLTNKVEGLKNLKKGFMQQMFV